MGFASACIPEPVEYGMPHALFKVNGTVQSNETESFIPGIKVIMGYDTTGTNANGYFEVGQIEFPEDKTFIVKFVDVDGNSEEYLKNIDTVITFTNPVYTNGDGNWYKGETVKTIEIKMRPFDEIK
jgi:putative lipoprotein (rSAM/lipoprotein system)